MPKLYKPMFREYDIRGHESAEELNENSVYHIARAFSVLLLSRDVSTCIVGCDSRGTSQAFRAAAIRGLKESGVNVVDIGTVTTPMSYFAQYHLSVRGLCMITASHNPVGWNGLKLGTDKGQTLLPHEIEELYGLVEQEAYVSGNGTGVEEDIADAYEQDLIKRVSFPRKLKILINTGNGTAGLYAPDLFRRAGFTVNEHYTDVDPAYPHYTPNPDGTAMMEDTGKQTVKQGCDLGLAFDGDGDRLGIVDENGRTVWPDRYLILLARGVLQRHPGAKIIFDVKVSEALPEDITAHGGVPIMWKTGHSYIKAKRAEEQSPLAGEMSGHIFFADNFYGFDDAFFVALKLLEYVAGQDKPFSELVDATPYYVATPTIQVEVGEEKKYTVVAALTKEFIDAGYRVVTVSGARVYTEDGWGLVRASSNTPTLVLRFESKTEEGLKRLEALFKEKLSAHGVPSDAWDTTGH